MSKQSYKNYKSAVYKHSRAVAQLWPIFASHICTSSSLTASSNFMLMSPALGRASFQWGGKSKFKNYTRNDFYCIWWTFNFDLNFNEIYCLSCVFIWFFLFWFFASLVLGLSDWIWLRLILLVLVFGRGLRDNRRLLTLLWPPTDSEAAASPMAKLS